MAFAETEQEMGGASREAFKGVNSNAMLDVTYEELALRLREHGFEETKASVTKQAFAWATLSAHFFLASLAVIGRYNLRVEDV